MTDLCRRCDRPQSEHTIGDQLCPGVPLRFSPVTDALARIAALEGALKPFAESAYSWGERIGDRRPSDQLVVGAVTGLTVKDFREARAVLSETTNE